MIFSSIDYSMSSPALCIYNTDVELSFHNCMFYTRTKFKKSYDYNNIINHYPNDEKDDITRFDKISDWIIEKLIANNVSMCAIEGYSYGSKSNRLFEIGENTGILKYKLYKNEIPFQVFTPGQIKKYFSSKGNSNKDVMLDVLKTKEGIEFPSSKSPYSDIVDSYAIMHQLIGIQTALP